MKKLEESVKVDVALKPVSLASGTSTGAYFPMKKWGRAIFVVTAAAMAKAKTVAAQVMQATDALGTGAKVITNALATIVSPTKATEVTVTATTVVDGNVITIASLKRTQIFTCEDTTPDASAGEFASGADDTAAMANLATVINLLMPELRAVGAVNVLTLTSREPGEQVISVSAETGTMVPAVVEAVAYVEVEEGFLDHENDFDHVAIKVTTDATIVVGADCVRGEGKFSPTQAVAAAKSDVS